MQDVDYTYNIKGQLTRMNDPENLGNDVFALRFYFDEQATGFSHHTYKDGNISAIQYNSKNLNALQTWVYTYDNLNRLTDAVFTENRYNETITYDKNGNIQSLQRKGKAGAVYTTIDQLSYAYHGNRLLAVNDLNTTETQAHGFTDNGLFKTGNPTDPLTHEYTYDVNGNLMDDANKMLHILSYNYLNLPDSIDFENDIKIKYLYASGGAKLRQVTYNNGTPVEQLDYSGSFVYENSSLKFIMTSEGRLLPKTGGGYEWEYFLSDHLGNTRVIFGKNAQGQAEIKQENHYYAYGMEIADQSYSSTAVPNTFLYNGKEFDSNTGYYQYGFRQYDAQIGRWHVVDALSEKYYSTSPYAYVANNPVSSYDVMGLYKSTFQQTMDEWYGHGNYFYRGQAPGTWTSFTGGGNNIGGGIIYGGPSGKDYDDYIKATGGGQGISFIDWYNKRLAVAKTYGYNNLEEARRDGMVFKWKKLNAIANTGPAIIPGTNIMADCAEVEVITKLILIFDANYFHGVRIYKDFLFDKGQAVTLPGIGIVIGKVDESSIHLLRHEFGHILQYKKWGGNIYGKIAIASLLSANKHSLSFNHFDTWSEWSANYLSYYYFNQPSNWNMIEYPIFPQNTRTGNWPPFSEGPFDFKFNWLDK